MLSMRQGAWNTGCKGMTSDLDRGVGCTWGLGVSDGHPEGCRVRGLGVHVGVQEGEAPGGRCKSGLLRLGP